MADITMKAVNEDKVGDRIIFDTGVAMVGMGGDNWRCGNCNREIMHEVPLLSVKVEMLYRCSACEALNEIACDD